MVERLSHEAASLVAPLPFEGQLGRMRVEEEIFSVMVGSALIQDSSPSCYMLWEYLADNTLLCTGRALHRVYKIIICLIYV